MEIQGYPNYLIYSDGRVFSKKRNIFKTACPGKSRGNYLQVCLHNGKAKVMLIHRLVAIHYIPNPDNKPQVDHINRNRLDNRVENLRWATNGENIRNQGKRKHNKSGHKNICWDNHNSCWAYKKVIKGVRVDKKFSNITDALVYKFCRLMINQKILRFP